MSGEAKSHRSRQLLLAVLASLLIAGLTSAGPAAAHSFTRNDPNDSRGRLDLRSVSVSHTSTAVVHKVRTYESWTPKALEHDSFFLIQIDKNKDRTYERCAFIFFAGRLRGSLTNCDKTFIRYLPVAKLSGTTAKITIPKTQTGTVYWWAVASRWEGPAPCGACIDFAPDNFPDILHDMIPPVVNLEPTPLRVWENSTTASFTFPFSISDAHSRIQSWTVQRREVGSASWTFVTSGTSGGPKSPDVVGAEGTRFDYRVIAVDKQGNQRIKVRRVYIPRDDGTLGPEGAFSVLPTVVPDPTAFGEWVSQMAATETLTYTFSDPGGDCTFELIGPGNGSWSIDVSADGGLATPVSDTEIDDLPRQTIYSDGSCATTYVVTVTSGTFALDAVLG